MRKTFSLRAAGKADARVLDAVKHEARKYVQRERRKPLPEGFDTWEFDCRVGADANGAEPRAVKEISAALDAVASTGAESVYVEIVARAAHQAPGAPRGSA
jgi:hypothetical protein